MHSPLDDGTEPRCASVKVVERMARASTGGGNLHPHITEAQAKRCCGPPPNDLLCAVAPETTEGADG